MYCVVPLSLYPIEEYPILYIFVIFLLTGWFFGAHTNFITKDNKFFMNTRQHEIRYDFRNFPLFCLITFTCDYGFLVAESDLISRRHGTEMMIKILQDLNIIEFLLIRIGDIWCHWQRSHVDWLSIIALERKTYYLHFLILFVLSYRCAIFEKRSMFVILYALIALGKFNFSGI